MIKLFIAAVTCMNSGYTAGVILTHFSCWLNMGHAIAFGTFVPIGVFSAITIIATEAATMDDRDTLPDSSKDQNQAAE